jgi:amino acid transporter
VFLDAYGPLVSYLFSWTAVSLLKPGSAAIISLIFGEYITKLLYNATTPSSASSSPLSTIEIPDWPHKLLATLAVLIISCVNVLSNRGGTGLQVVITVVKVASLLFVIVLGIVSLIRGGGGVLAAGGLFEGSSTNAGSYAIALYSGLWSFDGCEFTLPALGETWRRQLTRVMRLSRPIELCSRRDGKRQS